MGLISRALGGKDNEQEMCTVVTRTCSIEGSHQQPQYHEMRVDDFIADYLEKDANALPPSFAERAAILREQARIFRQSSSTTKIRFWKG
jgi:hypothetical protein